MNKKGFVLVETIITSVFVLGIVAFIVANVLPIIGEYEKAGDYDSVESIYDAHLIRKMILKSDDLSRIDSLLTLPTQPGKNYYLFDGDDICVYLSNENYCKALLSRDYLDVKEILVTSYTITDEFVKESANFDRGLKEYIFQMQKYTHPSSLADYNHLNRLIIYFNDGRITNIELLSNAPYS